MRKKRVQIDNSEDRIESNKITEFVLLIDIHHIVDEQTHAHNTHLQQNHDVAWPVCTKFVFRFLYSCRSRFSKQVISFVR